MVKRAAAVVLAGLLLGVVAVALGLVDPAFLLVVPAMGAVAAFDEHRRRRRSP